MKSFLKIFSLCFVVSQSAFAANCLIDLTGNDMMQFNKKEVTVDASCKEITIKLVHVGKIDKKAMGHNVVVSKEADKKAIEASAITNATGFYEPKDLSKVIAHTKTIGGGEKTEVKFPGNKLNKTDSFLYYCTFPGHAAIMTGKIIVK